MRRGRGTGGRKPPRAGWPSDPIADWRAAGTHSVQGQGGGSELLRWMVLLAKEMKIRTVVATFHADNESAIRLFRELNLPSSLSIHHGETEMRIQMPV